jgi:hypothetical protein
MHLAWVPEKAQAARMNAPDLDLDDLFLDAVEAGVLAALERIGDDPEARFRLFRLLLAVAEEEAVGGACRRGLIWSGVRDTEERASRWLSFQSRLLVSDQEVTARLVTYRHDENKRVWLN